MTSPDLLIALRDAVEIFDELAIPFVIGGSVASSFHGLWRTTENTDVATLMRGDHVARFCERAEDKFSV